MSRVWIGLVVLASLGWALAVNPLLPAASQLPTWPYPYAKEESTTTAAIPPAAPAPSG